MYRGRSWYSKIESLSVLGQMITTSDRPDYKDALRSLSTVEVVETTERSLWLYFTCKLKETPVHGALFNKKIVLSVDPPHSGSVSLEEALDWSIRTKNELHHLLQHLAAELAGDDLTELRSHPVLVCSETLGRSCRKHSALGGTPSWIDDGLTTFSIRAFDSREGDVGTIRVSRHITILYNLTDELRKDIVNLIFEKVLYGGWPTTSTDVFNLLDSLGRYVLPTEVDLYIHRLASRLALFGVGVAMLLSMASSAYEQLPGDLSTIQNILAGAGLYFCVGVIAYIIWIWSGIIVKRFHD